MIELKHKNWESISIPVYQEIVDIAKRDGEITEEIFDERELDILAVLCDSDRESLSNINILALGKLMKEASFIKKMPSYTPSRHITLRGVKYRVVVDMKKFTLAQYTEYNALRADAATNISRLLATMLIPDNAKNYADGYEVDDVVEAINAELPYYKAHGIISFFHWAQGLSLASSLRSEEKKLKKMARKAKSKEEEMLMKREARLLHKASTYLGRCLLSR